MTGFHYNGGVLVGMRGLIEDVAPHGAGLLRQWMALLAAVLLLGR